MKISIVIILILELSNFCDAQSLCDAKSKLYCNYPFYLVIDSTNNNAILNIYAWSVKKDEIYEIDTLYRLNKDSSINGRVFYLVDLKDSFELKNILHPDKYFIYMKHIFFSKKRYIHKYLHLASDAEKNYFITEKNRLMGCLAIEVIFKNQFFKT